MSSLFESPSKPLQELSRSIQKQSRLEKAFAQRNNPSILRRKSFLNFEEYIFLITKDLSHLYEPQDDLNISYFAVLTGFSNFEIISRCPLDLSGEVILSGVRSDYHVSIPERCTFYGSERYQFL